MRVCVSHDVTLSVQTHRTIAAHTQSDPISRDALTQKKHAGWRNPFCNSIVQWAPRVRRHTGGGKVHAAQLCIRGAVCWQRAAETGQPRTVHRYYTFFGRAQNASFRGKCRCVHAFERFAPQRILYFRQRVVYCRRAASGSVR